jgi:hypothetical protein
MQHDLLGVLVTPLPECQHITPFLLLPPRFLEKTGEAAGPCPSSALYIVMMVPVPVPGYEFACTPDTGLYSSFSSSCALPPFTFTGMHAIWPA